MEFSAEHLKMAEEKLTPLNLLHTLSMKNLAEVPSILKKVHFHPNFKQRTKVNHFWQLKGNHCNIH